MDRRGFLATALAFLAMLTAFVAGSTAVPIARAESPSATDSRLEASLTWPDSGAAQGPPEPARAADRPEIPRWLAHVPNLLLLAAAVFWLVVGGPVAVTAWRTPIPPVERDETADRPD